MPVKSLFSQISNKRGTYIDGYGTERESYEPKYITLARKLYNKASDFLNGKDNSLSQEEYYQKHGYNKPKGNLGIAGIVTPKSVLPDFSGVKYLTKGNFGFGGVKANTGLQSVKTETRSSQLLKSYAEEQKRDQVALEWSGKHWDQLTPSEQYGLSVKAGYRWDKNLIVPRRKQQNGGIINFQNYLQTLPKNQRDSTDYNVRRYWELNGKPKDFEEAIKKGMFILEKDGYWHANSIAYNKDTGEYEFMKSPNHPTIQLELDAYNKNKKFKKNYQLDSTSIPWKYVPIVKRDNFHNPDIRYKQGGILKAQPGGKLTPINPLNWAKWQAYKIVTDPNVWWRGGANKKDIIKNILRTKPVMDDQNKAEFLFGSKRQETTDGKAYDWQEDITKNNYWNVKSYKGIINPYNEYIVHENDEALINKLADKGYTPKESVNVNDEYTDPKTGYLNKETPYFDDVHNYRLRFHKDSNGQPVISASDLYDFGKNYSEGFQDLYEERGGTGKIEWQRKLLNLVGKPYKLVQHNIPIRFVSDTSNLNLQEKQRVKSFYDQVLNKIQKHQVGGIVYNPYISENQPIQFIEEIPEPYVPQYVFSSEPIQENVVIAPLPKETVVEEPKQVVVEQTVTPKSTSKRYNDKQQFISEMTDAYTKVLSEKGINPEYAKYLAIQDALESNFGKSYAGNWNFGNIIVGSSGASYTEGGDKDANGKPITQKFRNFDSLDDFIRYKVALLSNKRYHAFDGDIEQVYDRIKAGGYATAKNYVNSLKKLYEQYK